MATAAAPPTAGTRPRARFDDLRAGSAMAFDGVEAELVAVTPDEVAVVLDEVDRVAAAGRWAFGFVAYEAAAGLDPDLAVHEPVEGLPLAWFGVSRGPVPVDVVAPAAARGPAAGPWVCDWDEVRHAAAVAAVRERIAAGDTYQCNLTTRLSAPMTGDVGDLYADMALGQRGAHNALIDLGRFAVCSASPELFLDWVGDRVTMAPMKGTAARGRTAAEDDAAVARLRASGKDRAENVMIVDLVRNDLARVARTGSVTVTALCEAERFETVHQLTSRVTADVLPGTGLTDVFRALFPSGSVTGAPKLRSMELIRDLEDGPRGVYCGAIGVVAPPGAPFRARFSVAIRTAVVDRSTGTAVYGAGGGITWGSEPAAEYAELLAKARVLDARPEEFALLETMRWQSGRGIRSLDAHLARLAASAAYVGFRFDEAAARSALLGLTGDGDLRVRLLCRRDGALAVDVAPAPEADARPLRLAVDDDPIDSREWWPHHKTTRRRPYTERRDRHPAADEVVLVNERGEVTEACTANLAVRLGGRWWTPPLGNGCLPGVERGRLVAAGVLAERALRPADLRAAEELALVNSLRGWRPAVLAGGA
ncbi:chorismate-binding protein [Trujillonella endophytica]|uniref:Para-aminobenzoate synthetase / 4-amino-4-deoxychorismate lyase n=1 Tax=Trujillonella endophytica TaxID=673521 RepID=A0A1H8PUS3_9ACTN|nr:chorismate-binding protein [Trujillella endophytica]SEO45752.1 para-aminobenzoate synthetase / 4-amino-4-deoxychorismate lyase [Trujillella endophytica]